MSLIRKNYPICSPSNTIQSTDAAEKLGGIDEIKGTFIAFQIYLYANPVA